MNGKADVLDFSLLLQLPDKVERMHFLRVLVSFAVRVMKQVKVYVVCLQAFQLLLKNPGEFILPGLPEHGQLIRNGEAVPWVALYQGGSHHFFTESVVVGMACVKIGEALLQKQVHHLLCLLQINFCGVSCVQQGQAHTAKS